MVRMMVLLMVCFPPGGVDAGACLTCVFRLPGFRRDNQAGQPRRDTKAGQPGGTTPGPARGQQEEQQQGTGSSQALAPPDNSRTASHARHARHEHGTRFPGWGGSQRASFPQPPIPLAPPATGPPFCPRARGAFGPPWGRGRAPAEAKSNQSQAKSKPSRAKPKPSRSPKPSQAETKPIQAEARPKQSQAKAEAKPKPHNKIAGKSRVGPGQSRQAKTLYF